MGESGGMDREQLRKRYYSLVVQQIQKGASPDAIIPRLTRAGFSDPEAREMVNEALAAAGSAVAPVAAPVQSFAPDSAPQAPTMAPPPPPPETVRDVTHEYANTSYAGFWIRVLALFIDNIILSIALMPFSIVMQASGFKAAAQGQPPPPPNLSALALYMAVALVIYWLYFALQESSSKMSTVGKRICGMVVTDLNGMQISFGKATMRYIFSNLSYLTLWIGFIMAAFTERKQTLHDMIAGTVVIKVR
jgi:uncharacterized RDD family membrane protein YckC